MLYKIENSSLSAALITKNSNRCPADQQVFSS